MRGIPRVDGRASDGDDTRTGHGGTGARGAASSPQSFVARQFTGVPRYTKEGGNRPFAHARYVGIVAASFQHAAYVSASLTAAGLPAGDLPAPSGPAALAATDLLAPAANDLPAASVPAAFAAIELSTANVRTALLATELSACITSRSHLGGPVRRTSVPARPTR